MPRNVFTNPANGQTWAWPINHSAEQEVGRDRGVTFEANSANTGLVKQQGALAPLVLRYEGTILDPAQLQAMLAWQALCETQTIYFTDFAGDSYEVLITSFRPTRKRTLRNPRHPELLHYWTYSIELTVVRILAGVYAGQPA